MRISRETAKMKTRRTLQQARTRCTLQAPALLLGLSIPAGLLPLCPSPALCCFLSNSPVPLSPWPPASPPCRYPMPPTLSP